MSKNRVPQIFSIRRKGKERARRSFPFSGLSSFFETKRGISSEQAGVTDDANRRRARVKRSPSTSPPGRKRSVLFPPQQPQKKSLRLVHHTRNEGLSRPIQDFPRSLSPTSRRQRFPGHTARPALRPERAKRAMTSSKIWIPTTPSAIYYRRLNNERFHQDILRKHHHPCLLSRICHWRLLLCRPRLRRILLLQAVHMHALA